MKRGVILLFLVLFSIAVFAQDETNIGFDLEKSANWLRNESNAPLNVEELSMSILALRTDVNDLVNRLNEQKDVTGCFPKGRCTVKETALATYALYSLGINTDDSVIWLKANKIPWRGSGSWRIQIEAPDADQPGQCQLSYKIGEQSSSPIMFTVSGNNIGKGMNAVQGNYFINVATDLSAAILSKPSSVVTVDCSSLVQGVIISLMYKNGNNLYILKDDISPVTDLTIANACFGRGACNYEDTLYAAWIMSEMGLDLEELGANVYLEVELSNNPLHRAIFTRFNQKRDYLDSIKTSQAADGSWGGRSVYTTAFSVYSLLKASEYNDVAMKGEEFLQRSVKEDGSWNNKNVKDTAMTIIAFNGGVQSAYVESVFVDGELPVESGGIEDICNNLIDDDLDGYVDCGDGDCENFEGCIQEQEQTVTTENCYNDVDDDDDGLADCDDDDCFLECEGSNTEEPAFGDETEEEPGVSSTEEKSYAWLVWLIIIILILGGGVFFYIAYIKTGKIKLGGTKRSSMTFEDFKQKMDVRPQTPVRPVQRPVVQRMPQTAKPVRNAEDDALEKSLREAEKLLKGEK